LTRENLVSFTAESIAGCLSHVVIDTDYLTETAIPSSPEPDSIGYMLQYIANRSLPAGVVTNSFGYGVALLWAIALPTCTTGSLGALIKTVLLTDRLTAVRAGYLDNLSAGAVALEASLTAIKGLGWSTETLKVIKDAIAALNNLSQSQILSDATPFAGADIAVVKGYVDEVESLLKSATYGLSALRDEINANETKIDTVDSVVDAVKVVTDKIPRLVSHMDFWGTPQSSVNLTAGGESGVVALSNVIVTLPSGVTIIRVTGLLAIALIRDSSTSDNAIDVSTGHIEVKKSTNGGYVTAIDIPDNSWLVDVSTSSDRGGDAMEGINDVKAEVDGSATYNFEFDDIGVDGNNLELHDIKVGLRVYFTI
jgi:hypothetical protein